MDAALAARLGRLERPPPWVEVTTALRFMVDDGRALLHPARPLPESQPDLSSCCLFGFPQILLEDMTGGLRKLS